MKKSQSVCFVALLLAGVVDFAVASSGELGSQFISRSEMSRAIQTVRTRAVIARLDRDEREAADEGDENAGEAAAEFESPQEERHRKLDDEYLNLIAERLEQDADHHEALSELERERAKGEDVEEDYRELMEDRREQDAEYQKTLRELDQERAETNQGLTAEATQREI